MFTKIISNATLAAIALSALSGNVQAASLKNQPIANAAFTEERQPCESPVFWLLYNKCQDGKFYKVIRKHERGDGRGQDGGKTSRGGKDGRGDNGGRSPAGKN